jgi:hypothetical protein
MGKLGQEMVLHGPKIVEPYLIAQLHLGHYLVVAVSFYAGIVGFGYLNLIHHAEFHVWFLPIGMPNKYAVGQQPRPGVGLGCQISGWAHTTTGKGLDKAV